MEIIEHCINCSDSSGLHALQSTWDDSNPSSFSSHFLMKSKKTLLMTACKEGRFECCKFLLSIDSPSINTRNGNGFTALHYAAYHGHEEMLFLLLHAGADFKLVNNYQESALDSAIAAGHTRLAERLSSSRFLKPPKMVPGLFDFSSAFRSDLKDKLNSLPSEVVGSAVIEGSYTGDVNSSSSGCMLPPATCPGDDGDLSDGEIAEDKPYVPAVTNSSSPKQAGKNGSMIDKNPADGCLKPSKAATGLSRYTASKYWIEVTSVLDGGEETLVGLKCSILPPTGSTGDESSKRVTDDLSIGRSRASDFPLDDLSISKKHAVISYFNNVGFILRDVGSKHGTFIDNKRIGVKKEEGANNRPERNNNGMLLTDGMTVQFGRVVCRIFKLKQSSIISSGFKPCVPSVRSDPQPLQPQQSEELAGQKRTALMALYGHYEVPAKKNTSNIEGVRAGDASNVTLEGHRIRLLKEQQLQQESHRQLLIQQGERKEQEQVQQLEVGAGLLRKMGWDGTSIGRSGAPAAKPLTAVLRPDREGLGCDSGLGPGSSHNGDDEASKKARRRNQMIERFEKG